MTWYSVFVLKVSLNTNKQTFLKVSSAPQLQSMTPKKLKWLKILFLSIFH